MSCVDATSGGFGDRPQRIPDVATTAVGLNGQRRLGLPLATVQPAGAGSSDAANEIV